MLKKILTIAIVFICGLTIQIYRQWPDDNLRVIFCDVGQGDATLISYGSWQMLIDAGYNDQVLDCLRKNMPFWDKTIEVILATHPHQDHIGGFSDVLANYHVKEILLADVGEIQSYRSMLRAMKDARHAGALVKNTFLGQKIVFSSEGEMLVLGPPDDNIGIQEMLASEFSETILSDVIPRNLNSSLSENERSIVLLLKFSKFELLLMGDAYQSNELALIDKGLIKKVEGIKVGHHGSKTSTNPQFIKEIQPEFAVISCGLNNKFGHPSPEVLQILQENQVQQFRTDEQGTIKLTTNGTHYWLDHH